MLVLGFVYHNFDAGVFEDSCAAGVIGVQVTEHDVAEVLWSETDLVQPSGETMLWEHGGDVGAGLPFGEPLVECVL